MKKIWYGLLIIGTAGALCGCAAKTKGTEQKAGDVLEVHYIDVGQGDCSLIVSDGHAMLIDGGNNDRGEQVCAYLRQQGIANLDYIVATHPDADHIGGLDVVMEQYETDLFLYPDYDKDTRTYQEVMDVVEEQDIKREHPKPGETFSLGEASFSILAPLDEYEEANNSSIVLMLKNGGNRFLFSGDAEAESIKDMLMSGEELHADVYKVGHHGSVTAFSQEFLKEVDPQYAVISCGAENAYGHPHWEVRAALEDEDVMIYRTDEQGTVVAASDGEQIAWSTQTAEETEESRAYIVNVNTGKFHLPDCPSVSSMKEKNKKTVKGSAEELADQGYSPCGNCIS